MKTLGEAEFRDLHITLSRNQPGDEVLITIEMKSDGKKSTLQCYVGEFPNNPAKGLRKLAGAFIDAADSLEKET